MKVSVIIPNYNHALFLQQRIESVLTQTYPDFEVLILDDCSTDNSRAIIEPYKQHPKVTHVVFNEQNSGSAFRQWEKGLALAAADWIWVAESDDFCTPDLLACLVERTNCTANVVLSYCQSLLVDEHGTVGSTITKGLEGTEAMHWEKDFCKTGLDEIRNELMYKNTIPNASAVLFNKPAYQKAEKDFLHMKYCGDWWLWVHILQLGAVSFTAAPHNYFRCHTHTTRVRNTPKKRRTRIKEEYQIVTRLKDILVEDATLLDDRLRELKKQYCSCFTKEEIMRLLFTKQEQDFLFPTSTIVKSYLQSKAKV